jgi:hypothetical protein
MRSVQRLVIIQHCLVQLVENAFGNYQSSGSVLVQDNIARVRHVEGQGETARVVWRDANATFLPHMQLRANVLNCPTGPLGHGDHDQPPTRYSESALDAVVRQTQRYLRVAVSPSSSSDITVASWTSAAVTHSCSQASRADTPGPNSSASPIAVPVVRAACGTVV